MKPYKFYLTLAASVLTCAFVGHAQAADLDHADRAFFDKAAKSGMKEVAVSQAVLSKLGTSAGQEFAQTMITDHSKANYELQQLAARKGVTLPTDDGKAAKKWSEKTKDIDEDYFDEMVDDHKDAVKLFEKAAKSDDPDVAAFAQKTLPTLQHHLEMAKAQKAAASQ